MHCNFGAVPAGEFSVMSERTDPFESWLAVDSERNKKRKSSIRRSLSATHVEITVSFRSCFGENRV